MKKTAWMVGVVVLIACLAPDFAHLKGEHHGFHALAAFDALFGTAAAGLLVLSAVVLGKCLHRNPDYYDREGGETDV